MDRTCWDRRSVEYIGKDILIYMKLIEAYNNEQQDCSNQSAINGEDFIGTSLDWRLPATGVAMWSLAFQAHRIRPVRWDRFIMDCRLRDAPAMAEMAENFVKPNCPNLLEFGLLMSALFCGSCEK